MNQRLMVGTPDESYGVAQANGWTNAEILLAWLKHFAKHAHPSEPSPALLILDGHCSNKELEFDRPTTQSSVEPTSGPSGLYEPGEMLEKISPVPDANKRRLQCRKGKAQRSEILTSTQCKEML
ncbi:hypothetical protein PR048_007974 [Dryococelus australis]|uniref:DDE-1 domain-containing protein n=1 Tax=Dryococelus australis TaxID=614101 RepID=A0ABQ9HVS1_9NEOP|nr:hypothetical protein PR048_007974 [Dryococelus australis]